MDLYYVVGGLAGLVLGAFVIVLQELWHLNKMLRFLDEVTMRHCSYFTQVYLWMEDVNRWIKSQEKCNECQRTHGFNPDGRGF